MSTLLTIGQVAELLQLSTYTIRRLNRRGEIPRPLRLGRSLRWDPDHLTRWLTARRDARETADAATARQ